MNRIWYLLDKGKPLGPYSYSDLENLDFLTPGTYVWKEGFESWKKIRDVTELQALTTDKDRPKTLDNPDEDYDDKDNDQDESSGTESDASKKDFSEGDLTLAIKPQPPNIIWWLITLIIIIYIFTLMF